MQAAVLFVNGAVEDELPPDQGKPAIVQACGFVVAARLAPVPCDGIPENQGDDGQQGEAYALPLPGQGRHQRADPDHAQRRHAPQQEEEGYGEGFQQEEDTGEYQPVPENRFKHAVPCIS